MKYNRFVAGLPSVLLVGLVFLSLSANVVLANTLRQQTVGLHKGWNAIFLQIDPTNASPADCFQGTPVTLVAQFVGNASVVQYVQNPSTNSISRQSGWLVIATGLGGGFRDGGHVRSSGAECLAVLEGKIHGRVLVVTRWFLHMHGFADGPVVLLDVVRLELRLHPAFLDNGHDEDAEDGDG